MKTSTRLYAWLKLLTILHLVEQLMFGMQDLHEFQHLIAVYENRFGDTNGSIAALVTISASLAVLAVHCILKSGLARFITMFVLGLPTLGEFHHFVETMRVGHYTGGTVTAVPSIAYGVLFLRALMKEYCPSKDVRVREALQLSVAA